MRMLATNALHELAEQLKLNCEVLEAMLELTSGLDKNLSRLGKYVLESNGDKITRAYHIIDEIETIANEGEN